jgi:hypothetical protein
MLRSFTNTPLMEVQQFGTALVRTRDLDPLYVGLTGADLPPKQLARWILAYLCFYHAGMASWTSERSGGDYWAVMRTAAQNETSPREWQLPADRWPRAAERRHFRGSKCVSAIDTLSKRRPESYVDKLLGCHSDHELMETVQGWPMFGKWVSFKALDLLERCAWGRVQVSADLVLMYDQPYHSLQQIAKDAGLEFQDCYQRLLRYFGKYRAPPTFDRDCGPAEVETVVCKFGSRRTGHYYVGKDIHEQRAALRGWGNTAERLYQAYPEEIEQGIL